MTDRQTIIDLFEKHADWHDDLAWIEVGAAADLVVDHEDAQQRDDALIDHIRGLLHDPPTEDELSGEGG